MTPSSQPCLRHWRGWVGADEADGWLEQLQREVPWKQECITVYGRRHAMPRLTCWMADPGCGYRYSGLENTIESWTPLISAIRRRVAAAADQEFNSLLLNYYRNGRDAMGWHADDEPELDPDACIVSLSLGASRTLRFRPRQRDTAPTLAVELGHGDLLLMDPPTQRHWQHGLPRRLKVDAARLNLTFRLVRWPA
ncbi:MULTISPECIES: alpha-ketoglutarate-dependent dioxygenase AlkB [unclassified Cyanobium]|uniref:alpha-ketoglutarate-dependent dioxygenase AlkB family protein n=1 Tax=unclassified Cyanobium TaxID=2627006 RepID=UPI0020CF5D9F|nr:MULTISPECIES: alpha-ketoglutarate-dependent dioxygenase AlkB [unclassified Cyanobium]MCP9833567.1 alpha-ketoglutarate-dependent dioxygenase AlkB [Cyanobium sp. La Preciosa 7G6]MCP9936332.1 alpha-ketoglutarate-dependent dioxygenase AlkB [Cyanobium sp. Aljojuca 7A6]